MIDANLQTKAENTEDGTLIHVLCRPTLVNQIKGFVAEQYAQNRGAHQVEQQQIAAALIIQETAPLALNQLGLGAGARPRTVARDKGKLGVYKLDGSFEYTISNARPPKIENLSIDGLTFTLDEGATQEVCEEQLSLLQAQLTQYIPQPDDQPYVENDDVLMTLTVKIEDADGLQITEKIPYSKTNKAIEKLVPEMRERLQGAKNGDTFEFIKDAKITLLVTGVFKVRTPPMDDVLAKTLGFDSVDAIKEELRKEWAQKTFRPTRAIIHNQIREQLRDKNYFEVPELWVGEYVEALNDADALNDASKSQKLAFAEIMAASDYILELILQENPALRLTDDDIYAYATIDAMAFGEISTAEEFLNSIRDSRKFYAWKQDTQKIKVLDYLLSTAKKTQ